MPDVYAAITQAEPATLESSATSATRPSPSGFSQAVRVLVPRGRIAVFDYATITLANRPDDPLQTCVGAFAPEFVNVPWIARGLVALVAAGGWTCRRSAVAATSRSASRSTC